MAIVITRTLVLAATPGEMGASAPVIGWQNLVTAGGVSADHEVAGYPASNLANPSTAALWKSGSTASQYLTFTVSGGDQLDYVGLARHNLGTAGVNVSVEIPDPDSPGDWIEVFAPVVLPSNGPAILRFEPVYASQVRLRLQPDAVAPFIAVAYVGKLLVLERGLQSGHVPTPYAASDDIVTGQAESGDYLGRIVTRQSLSTSVSIQYLSYDWFLANMAPFAKAARVTPFFFAWMPAEYPFEVGYAWLEGDLRPEAHRVGLGVVVHVNLNMKAVAL